MPFFLLNDVQIHIRITEFDEKSRVLIEMADYRPTDITLT